MKKTTILKQMLMGTLTVVSVGVLAGCGNSSTTQDTSSSNSSSAKVSPATKAYQAANKLIEAGKYQQALDKLQATSQPTSKIKGLIANLKTLIQAKEDYNNKNYEDAQTGVDTLNDNADSSSRELKQEVSSLAKKVKQAQDTQSTSSTQNTSSNTTATASSSSVAANSDQSNSIVSSFAKAAGYYGKSGYMFNVTGQTGSVYTIEVRQNNDAGDVANLIGIYQYNPTTGSVNKTF
ncbi:hypothetical protein [Paucilactobacillus kaifaensis]|uniref:hypothetical protein n=1 Tax=Paucilactobacillus kaifaensis TaxID=2559921 RepID=UPI0010F511E8|nr:hypothetical protein [Paucilactobacillus kaifaensis]